MGDKEADPLEACLLSNDPLTNKKRRNHGSSSNLYASLWKWIIFFLFFNDHFDILNLYWGNTTKFWVNNPTFRSSSTRPKSIISIVIALNAEGLNLFFVLFAFAYSSRRKGNNNHLRLAIVLCWTTKIKRCGSKRNSAIRLHIRNICILKFADWVLSLWFLCARFLNENQFKFTHKINMHVCTSYVFICLSDGFKSCQYFLETFILSSPTGTK